MASVKKTIPDDPKVKDAPQKSVASVGPLTGATPGATPVVGAPGANQPPVVRRGPGTKEVIPFGWKLIGEANGLALTLFKAIERDDVEAQEERVRREGYYQKLRILANDDPVKQASVSRKAVDPHKGTRTVLRKKVAPKKPSRKVTPKSVKKTARPKAKVTAKASPRPRPKAGVKKAAVKKKVAPAKRVKKAKTAKKAKAKTPRGAAPKKKPAAKPPKKRTRAKK